MKNRKVKKLDQVNTVVRGRPGVPPRSDCSLLFLIYHCFIFCVLTINLSVFYVESARDFVSTVYGGYIWCLEQNKKLSEYLKK